MKDGDLLNCDSAAARSLYARGVQRDGRTWADRTGTGGGGIVTSEPE